MSTVEKNLLGIRQRIQVATASAGRAAGAARLLAVSKGQPAASIREAYAAGQREFGENYVQELAAKADELADLEGIIWHAIGPVQRNKAKVVARVARVVHTIDRIEIAEDLSKRASSTQASEPSTPLDVLIEINVANEEQKAGCAIGELDELIDRVAALPRIRLKGLMTIPPLDADPEANRPHFAQLRELLAHQRKRGHEGLVELSMGMSSDFEVAIAEGATIVRVGTAVFGQRSVPHKAS